MDSRTAFEAWAGKREKAPTTLEWDYAFKAWQAATERAYGAGWRACALWAKRDDLLADIDSPAYLADFQKAIRG